jgi:hypothetical protein
MDHMRTLLLSIALLAIAAGSTGCRMTTGNLTSSAAPSRARPSDNFGEILTVRDLVPTNQTPHGGLPFDNFGEIL